MPSPYSEARRNLLEKCLHGQLSLRPKTEAIPRRDPKEPVPLSYSQEQVWFHAQLVPDIPLYNEPVTIHYSGDLDIPALEQSFNEILHRHEAWRTGFTVVDGKPLQDVRPELSISLPVVDLRHLPEERRDSTAVRIATEEARKPLDLTQVPLFRARLIRVGDRQYRLYLVLSHIIFDGVAIYRIFLPELAALYQARVAGRPSPLPELDIQYPDYSCWQRKSLPPDSLAEHISYWRRQLGNDLPVLDLPSDYPRPPVQTFRGSMYPFTLSPSLTDAVKSLSRKEGVTLFQTLLAGFAALLCRYSGQDDLPIGSVTAGRDRSEIKPLLGYFLNTVVLRTNLSGDPDFRELLRRVRNLTLETLDHDCVPFGRLIHELNAPRDLSRNPLFQVMFSLEPSLPDLDPAWHLTQMDVDTEATKYDLYLELDERRDAILARFHYSTDLFDRTTIVRMSEHWMRLLEGAARDSSLRVSQLPLLSDQERSRIVVEWNQTRSQYAQSGGIHDLFNAQFERTPDNTAVREGERRLSFRQLQERSNRLAHYLRKLGASTGTRVALCVDRSFDMFVGLLGILKTGAAYVPLDPSHPPGRMASLLEDAKPAVLITQQKLLANAPVHRIPTVILDADWHKIARASADFPASDVQSDDPAYVLYTSGSSGKPKGVEGTHRGAMNRMRWMWERYPFEAGEVCCQKTNVGFVDSVWEIFGPLLAGVPSVILPTEVVRDPEELLQILAGEGVTRIVLVPSLLRALLDHAPNLQERVPRLKLWSCSGEALSGELARRFRQGFPEATLLNIYGSSEVAADVTWHEVLEKEEDIGATVPIGKPISNTQMYVLDPHRNPVPVGVRGEIYVGGDGLALGYWNRAVLTAERFVENPIAPEQSERLYRTGDLGRWRWYGEIEYLGRVDGEVKLRGMRIDLGEIESVLVSHAGVREGALQRVEEGGEARLVAYLVPEGARKADGRELRQYLRSKLPEHMVPARFVQVAELPLLPSGKVNRRALATVEGVVLSEQGMVAPRTAVEQKLAGMWREVLKVGKVGVDQNFFELGGHSLLVLQVMVRIRREFDVELGVRTMFEEPTIEELAIEVEKARAMGMKAQTPVLERRARPRAAENAFREALLAQLDTLSADDVQTLLKHVLDAKQLQ